MFRKKYTWLFLFALINTILLFGCGVKNDSYDGKGAFSTEKSGGGEGATEEIDPDAIDEEDSQAVEMAAKLHENPNAVSENVDEWIPKILEECDKEFIGGHLIDEGFLYWFIGKYGEDKLGPIAQEVVKIRQDKEVWYELTGSSIHVLWMMYCEDTGFQAYNLTNVSFKECASEEKTVITFTGDFSLAENINTVAYMDSCENGIHDCLSDDLIEIMQSSDILMINNEFTYSDRGTPTPGKAFTFRAKPTRVSVLNELGCDIVGVANNHVCDYGDDALLDTLETIDNANIARVGAGKNIDEASRPYYFICNGRKIAFVAATQIERTYNYTKEATDTTPGVLKTLNPSKFVSEIEEAKANSDYCIVFVHWGTENQTTFEEDQELLAKAYVNAGADAIIGGHTHCLQGTSYIDDVPIIYSLGNFWFSTTMNDGVVRKNTGLAQIIINKDGSLDFDFIPCVQEDCRTYLCYGDEKQEIIDWMNEHSKNSQIDGDGHVGKR